MASSKKKPTTPRYTISIRLGDIELTGQGATAYDALASIKRPVKVLGKTLVTITEGKREAQRLFMPFAAKRLFYPLAQRIIARQLDYLLK